VNVTVNQIFFENISHESDVKQEKSPMTMNQWQDDLASLRVV
jgi:hypothetical protein